MRNSRLRRAFVLSGFLASNILCMYLGVGSTSAFSQPHLREKIVLVVSFWARQDVAPAHWYETLAAIQANVKNDFLEELHVILDGSDNSHFNCDSLQLRLRSVAYVKKNELFCHARRNQPTYYDMFQYALQKDFFGKIVILANADMTFDTTVRHLTSIPHNTVYVIATQGAPNLESDLPDVREYLSSVKGLMDLNTSKPVTRCYLDRERYSWDAFAFRPEKLKLEYFLFDDVVSQTKFYMNEMFAENAAGHAVYAGSQGVERVYHVCDFVNAWHYHFATKMHRVVNSQRVRHWGILPPSCVSPDSCPDTAPRAFWAV
ncbi:hypothetical protein N9F40_01800 [bacterium]|nr:hypothetical protein [bacterium]